MFVTRAREVPYSVKLAPRQQENRSTGAWPPMPLQAVTVESHTSR